MANQPKEDSFVGLSGQKIGIGFAKRDANIKDLELQGIYEFQCVRNDQTHKSMRMLIDLKNIFAKQLPKMPKEYIVKLVFDRNHESMVILKSEKINGKKIKRVIGGICFRQFESQHFTEIVFLAITSQQQVKGFGTRLMNKFKEEMQSRKIEFLATFADNYAIGYFKKLGFHKEITMLEERWKGFIKTYEGGTFMECEIDFNMDYDDISDIIRKQKEFVTGLVKSLTFNERVWDGINVSQLKKKAQKIGVHPCFLIPGLEEGRWSQEDFEELSQAQKRSFFLQCKQIMKLMRKEKSAWAFLEPVNKEVVPDYFDIIKSPIDIKTIEKNLNQGLYTSKKMFKKDIMRVFTNAKEYNNPNTVYYKCAVELEKYISPYIEQLKEDDEDFPPISSSSKKIRKRKHKIK